MSEALQDLVSEHGAVLLALQILERLAGCMGKPNPERPAHLAELLDLFRGFVDRCHHAKEEDALFPELERRGVKREGGPIGVLLVEHEVGRQRVRAMPAGLDQLRRGDERAHGVIRDAAASYQELLRAHIKKEDSVIFPMAEKILPDQVSVELMHAFEEIERDRVGEGKHEAYHAVLHTLKDHYGVQ